MARPVKRGLNYFPLDTDFMRDRKIQRLTQKYGGEGISVYLAVLCELYASEGYYIPCSDDLCFDIGFTLQTEGTNVEEIIRFCVGVKLFDKGLFETAGILTSTGIQSRYREVCKKYRELMNPAWVLEPETGVLHVKTHVNGAKTRVNVPETPVFADKTPVKGKEKKSKLKTNNNDGQTFDTTADGGEAARRQELLRMAAVATANCPDERLVR